MKITPFNLKVTKNKNKIEYTFTAPVKGTYCIHLADGRTEFKQLEQHESVYNLSLKDHKSISLIGE